MTVLATGSGPRIDVATPGGRVLARNVAPEDLDRQVPGLEAAYRESTAADARVDGALLKLWADERNGVRSSPVAPPLR